MQKLIKLIVVVAAFGVVSGSANEKTVQAASVVLAVQAPAQDPAPASGELLSVNLDDKTIAVKASDGSEARFLYTDQTTVTGAEKGVAGLATMSGTPVTVYFRMDGTAKVATRIDVHQAKK